MINPWVVFAALAALFLTGCGGSSGGAPAVAAVTNGLITVTANLSQYAGVIHSIVYAGKQYVNAHEHGRLFQTALQVDGYGECHNPTEAGCAADMGKPSSTSRLVGHSISTGPAGGVSLATRTQAASWGTAPHAGNFCPRGPDARLTQPTSTIISKRVELTPIIAGAARPNMIAWHVAVESPDAREQLGIEILTGYLPVSFTRAYYVDRKTRGLGEVVAWEPQDNPGDGFPEGDVFLGKQPDSHAPIVWATEDGAFALGVLRPAHEQRRCEVWAYHLHRFALPSPHSDNGNACVKFSVVTHAPVSCLGNTSHHVVYLVFGSLAEVHQQIAAFH